jgi:amino acid adenylation domain-containing protein
VRPAAQSGPRRVPASFAQERQWVLEQLNPTDAPYVIPLAIEIDGVIDIEALRRAVGAIVARHESLRTGFQELDGRVFQVIAHPGPVPFQLTNLLGIRDGRADTEDLLKMEAKQGFDLQVPPLFRATFVAITAARSVLLLSFHHIISDARSVGLFLTELATLYTAIIEGTDAPLNALPLQYRHFSEWQHAYLDSQEGQRGVEYWRRQLDGVADVLDLPAFRPRPAVRTYHAAITSIDCESEIWLRLADIGRGYRATPFMTLAATFTAYLSRVANQDDIAIGTYIDNRHRRELRSVIGFFTNTLVLRSEVSGNCRFSELVERFRRIALDAYTHQQVPIERVLEILAPRRSLDHTPLFQAMLAFQPLSDQQFSLRGTRTRIVHAAGTRSDFDLTLRVYPANTGLKTEFEYATDLFDGATVDGMADHFRRLVEGAVADPFRRVSELPLLGHEERSRILVEWNQTERSFPEQSVAALVEEQVARTPDAIAVSFGSSEVTYRELNERANRSAHHLQASGVGPETIVAVFLDRSVELVVALLAVLKAGGAYLPLEPGYPQERLRFMLADAGADVIVSVASLAESLPPQRAPVILLDRDLPEIAARSCANPLSHVRPENLAYMIYTSGSTGKPKAVLVEQRAIANYVQAAADQYGIRDDDRILQIAAVAFDAHVEEIFPALIRGGSILVTDHEPAQLSWDEVLLARPTVLSLPTALWASLVRKLPRAPADAFTTLRLVVIGGEAARSSDLHAWHLVAPARTALMNTYGPTETTVVVTASELSHDCDRVPIGRPIANTQAYVLDEQFEPVPPGVIGELFIGGVQVARGYHGRPTLTAERFVPDPFGAVPGARLYQTGDLARYRPDGAIEFCGRVDDQIKIRGFRVEPGEVAAALREHDAVQDALVVGRSSDSSDDHLVAYLVIQSLPPTVAELRALLSKRLPHYMLPSVFVPLEALPVTSSGKVDRRALATLADEERLPVGRAYVAPRNQLERLVAGVWSEVLGADRVGVYDDFFSLGGHSLLATQVISRLRARAGIDMPLRAMFEHPTISSFVDLARDLAFKEDEFPPLERISHRYGAQSPLRARPDDSNERKVSRKRGT